MSTCKNADWVNVYIFSLNKERGQNKDTVKELSLSVYLGLFHSHNDHKPEESRTHFLFTSVSRPVFGKVICAQYQYLWILRVRPWVSNLGSSSSSVN